MHRSSDVAVALLRYLCFAPVITGLVFYHIIAGITDQLAAVFKQEETIGPGKEDGYRKGAHPFDLTDIVYPVFYFLLVSYMLVNPRFCS